MAQQGTLWYRTGIDKNDDTLLTVNKTFGGYTYNESCSCSQKGAKRLVEDATIVNVKEINLGNQKYDFPRGNFTGLVEIDNMKCNSYGGNNSICQLFNDTEAEGLTSGFNLPIYTNNECSCDGPEIPNFLPLFQ